MSIIIDKNELTDFLYLAKETFGPFQFMMSLCIYHLINMSTKNLYYMIVSWLDTSIYY